MDLTRIFTIGGKPGLQKLVAQSKNGVIVESLEDGKRFNASSNSKISSLEDITVFCTNEDKALKEILLEMGKKNSFKTIEIPRESELKGTLESYIPNLDNERVYASDVKKIFKWYNLLVDTSILTAASTEEKKSAKKESMETAEESKATSKKAVAKKPASKKPAAQTAANAKKKTSTKATPVKKTTSTAKKGA